MPPDRPAPNSNIPLPIRFQFSLKSLLIVTTVAAVCYSALFSSYVLLSAITCWGIVHAVPIVLAIGYVRGEDNLRAFCLGAFLPAGLALTPIWPALVTASDPFSKVEEAGGFRWYVLAALVVYFGAIGGCGLLAVWARRILEPPAPKTDDRADEPSSSDSPSPFA